MQDSVALLNEASELQCLLCEWKEVCRSLEVYCCYDRFDQERWIQHNQQERISIKWSANETCAQIKQSRSQIFHYMFSINKSHDPLNSWNYWKPMGNISPVKEAFVRGGGLHMGDRLWKLRMRKQKALKITKHLLLAVKVPGDCSLQLFLHINSDPWG